MHPVAIAEYGASARALLVRARALIADPGRWARHALALDEHGACTWPTAEDARRWDILGSLYRAWGEETTDPPYDAPAYIVAKGVLTKLLREHPGPGWKNPLSAFNDSSSTSHADVLDLFDRAIDYIDRAIGSDRE
jgi:hypothetical protein